MPVTVKADPPPARKAAPVTPSQRLMKKTEERARGLEGIGQLVSAGFLFARQPADAITVNKYWPAISLETARLAEDNPQLASQVDKLIVVGPYTAIIEAALPMFLQLAVNHGKLDATSVESLGVVSRKTMMAKAQVAIMQAEVEAMREQVEMERERALALQEYQEMRDMTEADRSLFVSPDAAGEDGPE